MRAHHVAGWMSTPVVVISPATTVAEAQRIMEQRNIRRLPVVLDGHLVGIVTRGDLRAAQPSEATTLSVYEWRALLDKVTVVECMTRSPLTISPDASVYDAARMMLEQRISGLPVVDGDRVVGVITESDLFRLMIAEAAPGSTPDHPDQARAVITCGRCGSVLRGRSLTTVGPDDQCWKCHYHIHRCENCKHFDGVVCLAGREERHTPIPGQHCPVYSYRSRHPIEAH